MHDLATLRAGGYRSAGLTKLKLTEPLDEAAGGFPREIFGLSETLELLDLSGTKLSSLPADFGARLPNLRIAFFSHCRFTRFPAEALANAPKLEMVAFRRNGMSELSGDAFADSSSTATPFGRHLRWLILTDNRLASLPASIGQCTRLEKCMLAGNRLQTLPDSMANCRNLTLLRLAANRLADLPSWLSSMPKLAFLSFAGNPCSGGAAAAAVTSGSNTPAPNTQGTNTPALTAGGSKTPSIKSGTATPAPLPQIDWDQIEIHHVLGEGASGIISKGTVKSTATSGVNTPEPGKQSAGLGDSDASAHVAVKIFRGALTSDGTPYDEMAACIAAGKHVNLVRVHGQVRFAEEQEEKEEEDAEKEDDDDDDADTKDEQAIVEATPFKGGLVMELIPPHYRVLGQPPSFDTCTRDNFDGGSPMPVSTALTILEGVASAAEHLHARGIAHGDLYAHNILVRHEADSKDAGNDDSGNTHAILSDFGAATLYRIAADADKEGDDVVRNAAEGEAAAEQFPHLEKLEVLAFAHLVEDVLGLMDKESGSSAEVARRELAKIHTACTVETVASRPTFATIVGDLAALRSATV